MYGMIHKSILAYCRDVRADGAANSLQDLAARRPDLFVTASSYSDSITLGLVAEGAAALGQDVGTFLEGLGEFWITFADDGPYAPMMQVGGETLPAFIRNLDRLHVAVAAALPAVVTPSFRVIEESAGELLVGYRSPREGLEPFVVGLLKGLARRFGQTGAAELTGAGNDGERHFRLTYVPQPGASS